MSTKKKLIVAVACLLVATCSLVTGTLAWLTTKTDPITNTFTTSDINITLTETKGDVVDGKHQFKMVPGATIEKDPEVTVLAGSEACWLFVKIEEEANDWASYIDVPLADGTTATFKSYISYDLADGWQPVDGETGVYCRKITVAEMGSPIDVLKNNQVTVSGANVTKGMMEALNVAGAKLPTLTFTAYACQLYKDGSSAEFTASEAWALVKDLPNSTNP